MRARMLGVAAILALAAGSVGARDATAGVSPGRPAVTVEDGNIVIGSGSSRKTLTNERRDSEAVLSPDGKWVIYTRAAAPIAPASDDDDVRDCASLAAPDELRRLRLDGSDDELLLRGHTGEEPTEALCGFYGKQFSADGATLYFLTPAWTTSHALHALALGSRTVRFVMPGNDFAILSWCTSKELRNAILVQQHRYFQFGGSFDWYWLFDPTGKKEIGPVGDFESVAAVKADIDASGRCEAP